ncbi:MAG TPA: YggS family pyridoxal phosphate-dependent enzyme, partial [Lacipirellula sp.]
WHLVGRLQRNKVRRTLPLVQLIHSVDSERLLAAIDEQAASLGLTPRLLLEVNCSGDEEKQGFDADDVRRLLPTLSQFAHVRIEGLMTMAALEGDEQVARQNFAALRRLRDELAPSAPPNVTLTELSMGMSGDFEAAVAEGATLVRIGSSLFEGLPGW